MFEEKELVCLLYGLFTKRMQTEKTGLAGQTHELTHAT